MEEIVVLLSLTSHDSLLPYTIFVIDETKAFNTVAETNQLPSHFSQVLKCNNILRLLHRIFRPHRLLLLFEKTEPSIVEIFPKLDAAFVQFFVVRC